MVISILNKNMVCIASIKVVAITIVGGDVLASIPQNENNRCIDLGFKPLVAIPYNIITIPAGTNTTIEAE